MFARTPPADDFGVDGARLVADFLEHHLVEVALHAAVTLDAVEGHAVDLEGRVAAIRSVNREVAVLHAGGAADIGKGETRARQHARPATECCARSGRRRAPARLITSCCTAVCTSTTGDCARHGDGLFESADLQVGVDRRREVRGQFEPVALDRAEPGQRERDDVDARPEIDDLVLRPDRRSSTERVFSISAWLAASTVTPGSTAPDVSLTMPAMALCACAAAGHRARHPSTKRTRQICLL